MSESKLVVFCDREEDGRYSFQEPFTIGGWRYATNGRVCAREPVPGEPDTDDGRKLPKEFIPTLFANHPQCNDPPPELTDDPYVPCKKCGGSEICTCVCGDEHSCPECKGSGRQAIRQCLDNCYTIHGPDLETIRDLPGVRTYLAGDQLYFVADGGIQGVCALREIN